MTSEYRVIFFDDSEIVKALIEHARAQGTKLPPGQASKLQIDRETLAVQLSFATKKGDPSDGQVVEFDAGGLSQAMIRYCNRTNIPLPVKANKTLRLLDGKVAFAVEMNRPATDQLISIEYI